MIVPLQRVKFQKQKHGVDISISRTPDTNAQLCKGNIVKWRMVLSLQCGISTIVCNVEDGEQTKTRVFSVLLICWIWLNKPWGVRKICQSVFSVKDGLERSENRSTDPQDNRQEITTQTQGNRKEVMSVRVLSCKNNKITEALKSGKRCSWASSALYLVNSRERTLTQKRGQG